MQFYLSENVLSCNHSSSSVSYEPCSCYKSIAVRISAISSTINCSGNMTFEYNSAELYTEEEFMLEVPE